MKIALGSDKSGFNAKEAVKAWLTQEGYEFEDLGTLDPEQPQPYYQVAAKAAPLVADGTFDRAVLICGTGAGMCIVSNKFKGVHAVVCESPYTAKMARAINNTKTFLNTEWCQDLEDWRAANMHKFAAQLDAIEDRNYGK